MSRTDPLFAAAARVEIVPPAGGRLGGFGCRFETLTGSLDPLFARILILQQGNTSILWASCDLLGLSTMFDRTFREQISRATSIPVQNILISCTHTHSAPVAMPARGPSGVADERWLHESVFNRVAAAATELNRDLRPVMQIKTGSEIVAGFGYNRQDSSVPIDDRVYAMCLIGEDRKPIATLVNYALHPVVIGEHNLKCSADFPGYVSGTIEEKIGGVALFIQGSCGDVDPVIYRDQGRDAGTVETIHEIGSTIASVALASLKPAESSALDISVQSCRVAVPVDPAPGKSELAQWKAALLKERGKQEVIPKDGAGRAAMYQLAWVDDLERAIRQDRVPDSLSVEISALRIGPVHVVTFPFEIYSQIGLNLRQALSPRHLILAAYTHGLIGYVVTADAKRQGGYGVALSHRYFPELLTPIGAGAEELLTAHGVSLARSVD